jgi:hypothetical protein
MANNKYVDFIIRITQQTKNKKLNWRYLDTNKALYEGMGWVNTRTQLALFSPDREVKTPNFNQENSFYSCIDGMFIVLYVWNDEPAKMFVIPDTYKKVVTLPPDEYGEHITKLLNLVQSQFPNAESFIDNYLSKSDNQG